MRRYHGLAVLLTMALAGCGGGKDSPSGASGARGKVVIDGSSTVFRISRAAQLDFKKANPDVQVLVGNHGTGGGFGKYLLGEVDIVDASRMAKPEEEAKAKEKKLDWTRFLVGYDGITVVVSSQNTFVKSLSVAQLKSLFEPDSKVSTWKDLDPSWPARKIILYSPDNDSGTFEFFTEAIVGKKALRKGIQVSPDDNTLVQGVSGDADGLGYFGYAYYAANKEKLRAVPIQKGKEDKPVEPNPGTILDKTYAPLSRPLFIYVKNEAMKRPEIAEFVTFYLKHVESLATKAQYVAPTASDIAENQKSLSKVVGK